MNSTKWYLRTQDETFGPESEEKLVEWARLGRIQPGQEISNDNLIWKRVEDVPFLDMRFSIDIGDGMPRGPFHRVAAETLLASGRLPSISKIVEVRAPFEQTVEEQRVEVKEPDPQEPKAPETDEAEDGEGAEDEVAAEIAEKVVEPSVEVPVEKVVEKIVEVPVEKIVEKVVVDETRVHELEELLAEERRHTGELQVKMDESSKKASEASKTAAETEARLKADLQDAEARMSKLTDGLKDAVDRENKYVEQIHHLEDELRRLPQTASEVADIQSAMYGMMTEEADELVKIVEAEKREFEAYKSRQAERESRLLERRREILKRAGANIDEMTHRALIARPEDPRTVQLRRELDEQTRLNERNMKECGATIRQLEEKLRQRQAEDARRIESAKDITQMMAEEQALREKLQRTEKALLEERQKNEALHQQLETRQQTLLARLAALESPSIGTAASMETNQSREARQVKLPGWMRLGK